MEIAIAAEGLGKQYRIGRRRSRHQTLRETLTDAFRSTFDRAGRASRDGGNAIWALRDVSFEIKHGEVVGIIGRNGAGKSTLLKILSRITEPTTGTVDLRGRVGSLLEVGTGFHFELTGRENIYLSGAVLGMRRRETDAKFDEIVAFAEVGPFLDTPVKHYSSGMYLRLAFAVAAHLDSDILIVDEVLAVGDASFQKKCLSKMHDVSEAGRTVLFVSHNMPAVARLCERAIMIEDGRIVEDGSAPDVVHRYLNLELQTSAVREWPGDATAPGGNVVRLRAARVLDRGGRIVETADIRQPVGIQTEYDVLEPGHIVSSGIHLRNDEGLCVFTSHDLDPTWRRRARPAGRYTSTAWIPGNLLTEGMHFVSAGCSLRSPDLDLFLAPDVVAFQVIDRSEGDSARGDFAGYIGGVVRPMLSWETRCVEVGGDRGRV